MPAIEYLLNVIQSAVIIRGCAVRVGKCFFLPNQTGFSTLAELNENKRNRAVLLVTKKQQTLCLQLVHSAAGTKLAEPFRTVDDKEITAILQRTGCSGKQFVPIAAILPTGEGRFLTLGAGRKIGGIGNAARKTSGRKKFRNVPQVAAYTIKTVGNAVLICVMQRHFVRIF